MKTLSNHLIAACTLAALFSLTACGSVYYKTMEQFGVHKRDILVDRVEEGRDAQQEAKEQFRSALEAFRSVSDFDGGDLEATYSKLNDEFERSQSRAKDVTSQIASIETVSEDLFEEWSTEVSSMQNAELRSKSQQTLDASKQRYGDLISVMKKAADKMEPVLVAFRDHVLFLKHNLNANAISSLEGELVKIESNVAALITDMEASIAEADSFIASMDESK